MFSCSATSPRPYLALRTPLRATRAPTRQRVLCCRASSSQITGNNEDDDADDGFEGLAPEDDWVVPGNNTGSLSLNTELGRAVDGACDELQHLAGLESDILQEADDILKKFGFKTGILNVPAQEGDGQVADQE